MSDNQGQGQGASGRRGESNDSKGGRSINYGLWRDPIMPSKRILDATQGRVLDPGTALAVPGVRPFSTVYVGPRLTISRLGDWQTQLGYLRQVALKFGWALQVRDQVDGNFWSYQSVPAISIASIASIGQNVGSFAPASRSRHDQ